MTIGDLYSAGIELQGDDIRVKIWNDKKEVFTFDENLNEMKADCSEIQTKEIRYMYVEDGKLVIELEVEYEEEE